MGAGPPAYTVVVPTVGRPSLGWLVAALDAGSGPPPAAVVVVDDRAVRRVPLPLPATSLPLRIVPGTASGPAAARNRGWREATTPWVAFLDDDVVPGRTWPGGLSADLAGLAWDVAASQGRIRVPLAAGRRPRDWERNVAGLESACWATADMAYRRQVLEEVGGFDERFGRAFREDADLGLRVVGAGYTIVRGERTVEHPVGPAGAWVSVRLQRGNADDVLMAALHGRGWRQRAHTGPGRNGRHLAAVAAGGLAAAGMLVGRRRVAAAGAAVWGALTAEFAAARIAPGPGDTGEVVTMLATSAAIPAAACWHAGRALVALPGLLADGRRAPLGLTRTPLALSPPRLLPTLRLRPRPAPATPGWRPAAVLFDRDGTLVVDRPYNADPASVVPMPGARVALRRARAAGLAVGVVTNQSGIGRGLVSTAEVASVHGRIEALLGPFDTWQVCPHAPGDGCACRKPAPGLIKAAAADLGVDPSRCAVVGDIGSDVEAALAAGARPVLVPTRVTRRAEVAAAPAVVADLLAAVDTVLAGA